MFPEPEEGETEEQMIERLEDEEASFESDMAEAKWEASRDDKNC